MMSSPKAVLISDIHFTVNTLELATKSLEQAQAKAREVRVPLIICGDTLDSKAIMRAECVNRLIDIAKNGFDIPTIVLVGNHDMVNSKGADHALNFLRPYWQIVDKPTFDSFLKCYLVPYQDDPEQFASLVSRLPSDTLVVCHQGFKGANMGHYVKDHSGVPLEAVAHLKVISGHYHARQTLGSVSYIGNPYSLSFGEAKDPLKGFQILMDDGRLEFVPTNLRKHVIIDLDLDSGDGLAWESSVSPEDIVWVKVSGSKSKLDSLLKSHVRNMCELPHNDFKLDLIPIDREQLDEKDILPNAQPGVILDNLIDSISDTMERKAALKSTWRTIFETNQS